jgi:hypothetical protein
MIRGRYLVRLSIDVDIDKPEFGETPWTISEDVNVEHLLNVFKYLMPEPGLGAGSPWEGIQQARGH